MGSAITIPASAALNFTRLQIARSVTCETRTGGDADPDSPLSSRHSEAAATNAGYNLPGYRGFRRMVTLPMCAFCGRAMLSYKGETAENALST